MLTKLVLAITSMLSGSIILNLSTLVLVSGSPSSTLNPGFGSAKDLAYFYETKSSFDNLSLFEYMLKSLGFGNKGIQSKTFASYYQSVLGKVSKNSWFSKFTSWGAKGCFENENAYAKCFPSEKPDEVFFYVYSWYIKGCFESENALAGCFNKAKGSPDFNNQVLQDQKQCFANFSSFAGCLAEMTIRTWDW